MVEDFTQFPIVEPEMESDHVGEKDSSGKQHEIRHLSMAVCVEGIVSNLVSERFVMGIRLVDDEVRVSVWGENILVTRIKQRGFNNQSDECFYFTYWNIESPFN